MTTIAASGSERNPESRRDELQDKGFSTLLAFTA